MEGMCFLGDCGKDGLQRSRVVRRTPWHGSRYLVARNAGRRGGGRRTLRDNGSPGPTATRVRGGGELSLEWTMPRDEEMTPSEWLL